jgi:cytochrome c-type biogenesis protein CcmH/NrfG
VQENQPDAVNNSTKEIIHTPVPVHGYTAVLQTTLAIVNENKKIEELVLRLLDKLKENPNVDQRWLQIGRTDIEKGFMSINRSVFKPQRFDLR